MRARFLVVALLAAVLIAFGGCKSSAPRTTEQVGKTGLSSEVLAVKLREACDNYNRAVAMTASDLSRGSDDSALRRLLILWQLGTLSATENAYSMKLRFEGLASLYLMALQRVELMSREGTEPVLAQHTPTALRLEQTMAEYLDGTLRELLPENAYLEVSGSIRKFAAENPMSGLIRKYGDATTAREQSSTFLKLSSLTEPLMITEGVKETAASISEVADSVNQIARTVENIPTLSALQLQLLLLNLKQDPLLGDLRRSARSMSESAERFATIGEQLPTRIREEVVTGLDQIEATRADLKDVVENAATTATEARKAVEQVNTTLQQAETTLAGIQRTTENIAAAGAAWNPVFENLRRIAAPRSYDPDYVPPPPEPGPDPDLENLARTAESISAAGDQLHAAIVELRGVLDSGQLPATFGDVDATARGTVDFTTERLAGLVDRITLRLVQLVGAILVAALLYRFLRRFVTAPART